ncbi:MAG: 50S ribosomal protein L19 [Fuerstiella sp.]
MRNKLIDIVEKSSLREVPLNFTVGDTVDVHTRILEGSKERVQVFSGVVIAKRGHGMGEMFTVRRIVAGEGVERTFPVNTPKIAKIEIKRHGRVRRAKLFYLRERTGKATRLRERKSKPWEVDPNAKKS